MNTAPHQHGDEGPPVGGEFQDGQFHRVHPISPLLRVGIFVVAGAVAFFQQVVRNDTPVGVLLLMAAAIIVVGFVYGLFSWWFTRYRIDPQELRIDSGVLLRRSRRISIERLQAVDVVQPFLARFFGMAELRFEVAGGSKTEAPLAYLRLDDARRLRATILHLSGEGETAGTSSESARVAEQRPRGHEQEIVRVQPQWLVFGTLLSTEFVVSILALIVLGPGAWAIGSAFEAIELTVLMPASLAVVVPWVIGIGSILMKQIIDQWGFVLSDTGRGWHLRRGLLSLRSQTVPLDRIQGFAVKEPLLWRRLGMAKVQVDIAGYAEQSAETASAVQLLLPVVPRQVAFDVLGRLGHGSQLSDIPVYGVSRRAALFRPIGWRYLALGVTERVVMTVQGWMVRRTDIVPHHKAQSVHLSQGPVQRWLGVADVHIQTTRGPCNAIGKHRSLDDARSFVSWELERARAARRAHDPVEVTEPPARGQLGGG